VLHNPLIKVLLNYLYHTWRLIDMTEAINAMEFEDYIGMKTKLAKHWV